MQHGFRLGETELSAELSRAAIGYRLHVGELCLAVSLQSDTDGFSVLTVNGHRERVLIVTRGDDVFVQLGGTAYELRYEHPLQRLAAHSRGSAEDGLRAPMPGSLVTSHVSVGQTVERGQSLLVIESMKMQSTLVSPCDGAVLALYFTPGQSFDRDALLLTLDGKPAHDALS
jgi:biotin carboxyl carrier protein